jgi:hypothetical protein
MEIPDLPDGIYKDFKKLGLYILRPFLKKKEYNNILKSFSNEFGKHSSLETCLANYYLWHEDDFIINSGTGQLLGASYGELLHLWAVPNQFIIYEAQQVRFKINGGEIKRLFIFEPNFRDASARSALIRAILRHQRLGFSPKVLSPLDLKPAIQKIGVN